MYITVEGNIGAGKSTLLPGLAEALGWQYVLEDIDSDPRFHELVRRQYDGEIEAIEVDRYLIRKRESIIREMQPGSHYIIERSLISSVVFNRANGGCDRVYGEVMESLVNLPKPASMVYLSVAPEVAMSRVRLRSREAEDNLTLDYLEQIHQGHEHWLPQLAEQLLIPMLTVDCSSRPDMQKLSQQIMETVQTHG